jgi:DNA replication protein DnaC
MICGVSAEKCPGAAVRGVSLTPPRNDINNFYQGEFRMLNQQTLQRLRALKLTGMADAFAQQLEQPPTQQLSFEERLALLVDRERTHRDNRRLQRLLRSAHLKQQACVEEIDYQAPRGLVRAEVASLISCDWVRSRHNLHITGPTGTGKSWLACAFGHAACRQGLSVRYQRTGRLLDELRIARGDGSYSKLLRQLARLDLLILDDFGLKPLAQNERHDLLEVIEDRHGSHSTIITSQLPIGSWHDYLNDPTVADALLDRLLANAHRLELKGESLRKTRQKLTHREHSK